jgi:hypothetical protein
LPAWPVWRLLVAPKQVAPKQVASKQAAARLQESPTVQRAPA